MMAAGYLSAHRQLEDRLAITAHSILLYLEEIKTSVIKVVMED